MLSDRDRQHILNLHAVGNGRRRISALTGIPQYDVRKVLEEQRDQHEARSRVGELPDAGDGPAVSVVVWDIETTDFKTDPIVAARWVRRSDSSPVDSMNALLSIRSLNGRRMRGTPPPRTGRTSRSIARRDRARTTSATRMMITIFNAFINVD